MKMEIKISKKKKFVEESLTDYYLLVNFLLKFHSDILIDFQNNILKGRPIKSGLDIKY